MRYPKFMVKINGATAIMCGAVVFIFALLAVMESILRQFFNSPTVWTLNITQALFIWAAFLGSSWAFQEHGHVAVDLMRDLVDKHTKSPKRIPRRVMAVFGYICAFIVMAVILYGGWIKTMSSAEVNEMHTFVFKFPVIASTIPIVIGSIQMLVTLIFMILDILAGGEKYL